MAAEKPPPLSYISFRSSEFVGDGSFLNSPLSPTALRSPRTNETPYTTLADVTTLSDTPISTSTSEAIIETPLPWSKMFVLALVQLTESIAVTMIMPFAAFMVQGFLDRPDEDPSVGTWTGLMDAAFPFAQFLTSYWWGTLSDRIGRRPCLLAGVAGTTITMFAFGFSLNLPMAIALRFASGFFNGNNAIIKTYLGEITDSTNQSKGFAQYAFVYAIGLAIGPLIGGVLAEPADKYDTFKGTIFEEYPYLLPCVVTAVLSASGFIFGLCFLSETLDKSQERERRKLLRYAQSTDTEPCKEEGKLRGLLRNQQYMIVMILYAIASANGITYQTIFPLWAKIPLSLDGFGWDTSTIGSVQAFASIGMACMNLGAYPLLVRRFNTVSVLRWTCWVPAIGTALIPVMGMMPEHLRFPIFSMWIVIFAAFYTATSTCVMVLLRNTVYNSELGSANGFAQTVAGGLRAIGPILIGTLFSISADNDMSGGWRNVPLFNRYAGFYLLFITFTVMAMLSLKLSPKINKPKEGKIK